MIVSKVLSPLKFEALYDFILKKTY